MPAVVNAGSVILFNELPIVTPPVELPVLIFVALLELLFKSITPPDIVVAPVTVAPDCPVSNPADVIAPVPVVDMFPLVVTASPDVVGDRVVPVRSQYPIVPDVGGAEVKPLVPFVYTPALGVNPLTVSPAKVGDAPVCIFCGVDSVIVPDPFVTLI
jgi:hypothetical protein